MRVTSKGQVTIPKHLRDRTSIKPGSQVDFEACDDGLLVRKSTTSRGTGPADDFEEYLDDVTGIVDLGMSTDAFMELMRGE
ncbi:AbrB/MazE/SpoVT family DNA-binding domain-containing protein [Microbaculum marinum]|uniref:AbrB/MazE/SpoVT family DNA-binding domain-containing protein n=1 Tax=Microbaculum marinum TaxID=1764581 RepID=A0AAW9RQB1_9HYPH